MLSPGGMMMGSSIMLKGGLEDVEKNVVLQDVRGLMEKRTSTTRSLTQSNR